MEPPVVHDTELLRTPEKDVPTGRSSLDFTPIDAELLDNGPRLDEAALPFQVEEIDERPEPLLEWGDPFLDHGPIRRGVELPGGAVWQPRFLLHGRLRSAVQSYDDGRGRRAEWANRLDLFGDLILSGTERVHVALRPLDSARGNFTGLSLRSEPGHRARSQLGANVQALFFEGEFGELLPGMDPSETRAHDWGFTVGRAPLRLQEGLLLDDTIDLVGVTRNSLMPQGTSNLRVTGFYGWHEVNRGTNVEEESAHIFGLSAAADGDEATRSFDVLFVYDERDLSDAWYMGFGSVQRLGAFDTTFRVVSSQPVHDDTARAAQGTLFFTEVSRTLEASGDVLYVNAFWNPDDFTSAARAEDAGDAVARTGLLFEPAGMGHYGAPLGGRLEESVGSAVGYQVFLDGIREHIVVELGGLTDTTGGDNAAAGVATRYQRAIGQRHVLRIDAFAAGYEARSRGHGLRVEWLLKF